MPTLALTYKQWIAVDPRYRSKRGRTLYVACYDRGDLVLARVRITNPHSPQRMPVRAGAGQLSLLAA